MYVRFIFRLNLKLILEILMESLSNKQILIIRTVNRVLVGNKIRECFLRKLFDRFMRAQVIKKYIKYIKVYVFIGMHLTVIPS